MCHNSRATVPVLLNCRMRVFSAASAQTSQSPGAQFLQPKDDVAHYLRAVPRSPAAYPPITPKGRLEWFIRSTVGPRSLTAGLFSAGYGTATNSPHEYGTHWAGFGDRYGMRLTGISTGNAIEASLGAAWGKIRATFTPFTPRSESAPRTSLISPSAPIILTGSATSRTPDM